MNLVDAIKSMRLSRNEKEEHQLYTSWGENLNRSHVREEYPRPQLARDNYLILNGFWDYKITRDKSFPEEYQGKILVPFSPESILSGVNYQLQPGEVLWYHTIVRIKSIPQEERCILHFGAVDQACEVYVNHKRLANHVGGYLPFSIDITDVLVVGKNVIELAVTDDTDTSYHSRGKQKLERGGMFYTAQSGIWQTVWMEWVPQIYIESLRITPLYDESKVRVEIFLNNEAQVKQKSDLSYIVEVYKNGRLMEREESKNSYMTLNIANRISWSPENPFLYDLNIMVGKDKVKSYFAMRKIAVKVDNHGIPRIQLNNMDYFQNGVLDQGYWPDGLYTAPSDEAMIFDIEKAKELGFNMIRKHIKIEPLRWYYHCDRLGMLVWQDMVNGGEAYKMLYVSYLPTVMEHTIHMKDNKYRRTSRKNRKGRDEWSTECKETIKLLYNCPCIVAWVPFNEGWGQFDAKSAVTEIKSLDRTRLVDHASGWFDQKLGDIKSVHNYFRKLSVNLDERAFVLSEYGGFACYVEHHSFSGHIYGYRRFHTIEKFQNSYRHLLEEEVRHLIEQGLSAAVYTQLTDVEDEVNGLLTYDRKVVKAPTVNIEN